MLFLDDSCLSASQTLQRHVKLNIPQMLGSDWFGIISLTPKGKSRIESDISLKDDIDSSHALEFAESHVNELFSMGSMTYRIFSTEIWEYVVFPIRMTEKGYFVFTLHGRQSGHFDLQNIHWYTVFADAAYARLLLQNQYIQEVNFVNSILDSTTDLILVLDASYHIISQNNASQNFWGKNDDFSAIATEQIKNPERLLNIINKTRTDGTSRQVTNVVVISGSENHILNVAVSPLCNSKSQIPGTVLVGTDVTQQQLFDYQFEHFKHYGLLGEVALGLSHDIKNPLMNIANCTNAIKKDPNLSDKSAQLLHLISGEVNRINGIIDQMLSFGKVTRQDQCIQLNINHVLYDCIAMVSRQKVFRTIDISSRLDETIPPILAKNADMQQVFLNVLLNAIQAISEDGFIFVESRYTPEEETIHVTITDNGSGLEGVDTESLFSPYYTTKKNGSGLGLFITRKNLSRYGGSIVLKTDEDGMTVCHIALPVVHKTATLLEGD